MTLIGAARLFGGPSTATGEPAQLFVDDAAIEVHSAHAQHRVPISALRIREVGGGGAAGLELGWDSEHGPLAVQVFDAQALRSVGLQPALLSAPAFRTLRNHEHRRRIGRIVGWSALALLLLAPLLLLLGFLHQSDRIAAAIAARIPAEQEAELGRRAFESMRPTLQLEENGAAYEAVQALGARLTHGSRYRYQFHLARNEQVNAFALPGGVIVIHTGLIAATRRPEELAGVLAHEVQHVELRHSLQALIKNLGLRGVWLLVTGDVGQGVLGQTALELTSLTFSREAERQADAAGFDALVAADVDPRGMADFFAVLAEREGAAPPALLSTHPASDERERALRTRVEALRDRQFTALALGHWPPP